MIRVVMSEKDLTQVDQTDRRRQELPLRSFPAIEQQSLATAAHEQRRRAAERGRHRPGRAEKDEIEIHATSMAGAARSSRRPGPTGPRSRATGLPASSAFPGRTKWR